MKIVNRRDDYDCDCRENHVCMLRERDLQSQAKKYDFSLNEVELAKIDRTAHCHGETFVTPSKCDEKRRAHTCDKCNTSVNLQWGRQQ